MQEALGRFFGKRDIDFNVGALSKFGFDIEQAVDQFGALTKVDHSQAAAFIVSPVDCLHIEAQAVIDDLKQGQVIFQGFEAYPDIGSIGGGWLSSTFIKHGLSINKARKLAMSICALAVLPIMLASKISNMWLAVGLVGLAAAAHQGWSANIFTTVSDMFPKKAVASVTGIGGMAGAVGGILIAAAAGLLFKHYQALEKIEVGYGIMFVVCGLAYLAAWIIMHLLVPKFRKIVL